MSRKNVYDDEDVIELRNSFKLFADSKGKVFPRELKHAFEEIEMDQRNPRVYKIIADLDIPDNKNGINFDSFMNHVNLVIGDLKTKDGIRTVYEQFLENPRDEAITLNCLRNITKELGESVNTEELRSILARASKNGVELPFNEFYAIISRKQ
jgi:Ca2+-binding EF-hand superfamily protein